ncbi:hypothetical protein FLA_2115 [Filimonas lacunae]|nr:hypothetical protein FLA_2115 [Filimonas lacunae]
MFVLPHKAPAIGSNTVIAIGNVSLPEVITQGKLHKQFL